MSLPPAIQAALKFKVRRFVQTIADLAGKPWSQLRILDLGSNEGDFALEFASHGARVVGIEGREGNNAVARGMAGSLGLASVEFVTDDVRNFSRSRFGTFDVVLCAGLLYHLPAEDGCRLIHSITEACTRLMILDTHVGQRPDVSVTYGGRIYHGDVYREFVDHESVDTKLAASLASLDNAVSFWMTLPSVLNLLRDVGFSSVYEIHRPHRGASYSDRFALAALKGEPQEITVFPELRQIPEPDFPEVSDLVPYPRPFDSASAKPVPRWKCIAGDIKRRILKGRH